MEIAGSAARLALAVVDAAIDVWYFIAEGFGRKRNKRKKKNAKI